MGNTERIHDSWVYQPFKACSIVEPPVDFESEFGDSNLPKKPKTRINERVKSRRLIDPQAESFNLFLVVNAIAAAALVLVAIAIFSLQFSVQVFVAVGATAGVLAAGVATLGGLVGFLFGIPKALQSDAERDSANRYVPNSNLEQISDWLTKILVGVGLVQISSLPSQLERLGQYLAPALGGADSSAAFAIGLLLYSFVVTFVIMYMWTRTQFLLVLDRSEAKRRSEAN